MPDALPGLEDREADLRFVDNGEEMMDYLSHTGKYADASSAPRPSLILLDLNMPRDSRDSCARIPAYPLCVTPKTAADGPKPT